MTTVLEKNAEKPVKAPADPADAGQNTPDQDATLGAFAVVKRGLRMTPTFRKGLGLTLTLALIATAGRVVVPLVIQRTLDDGFAGNVVHLGRIHVLLALGVVVVLITAGAQALLAMRLVRTAERGLAELRTTTFAHVHRLSVLHQAEERRGSLVSRVTQDVDEISRFMQFGGVMLIVSAAQLVLATVLMLTYSVWLTLLVYACFVPLTVGLRFAQGRMAHLYLAVRQRAGDLLTSISEAVIGAPVIRAHNAAPRTIARLDDAVEKQRSAATRAQTLLALVFSTGEIVSALANAGIVVLGIELGIGGHLSYGQIVGFLFLSTLFVQPVQVATETLNDAQNAVAGWRRVQQVLDIEVEIVDPGEAGTPLPAGALDLRLEHVTYRYSPDTPDVLHDVTLHLPARARVAVVGETGSGKTTVAKLLVRLMDPSEGRVLVGGVPLTEVPFSSLRGRVLLVPQEGFLSDGTIADNVRTGDETLDDAGVLAVFDSVGLTDWVAALPAGVQTRVGERGGRLSAGERQLVALARSAAADPAVLVLDEATSAVDPATEVRVQRALERLAEGRTTITIAHRLSTAEAADTVVVVDAGRVVQQGPHAELVAQGGVYGRLHASWAAQKTS